jgi:hypothetical protein
MRPPLPVLLLSLGACVGMPAEETVTLLGPPSTGGALVGTSSTSTSTSTSPSTSTAASTSTSPSCVAGALGPGRELPLAQADAKLVGDDPIAHAGASVASAGDVDGDGLDDLLIGAFTARNWAGATFVVRGPASGMVDLATADAVLHGEIASEPIGDYSGVSVAGVGDVNGDGFDDVAVGAPQNDEGGADAGAVYVVYGPVTGPIDLANADAKLVGEAPGDGAGRSVAGVGDVDGDGFDDLLIGADGNQGGGVDTGAAYVVYGPVAGRIDLANADAKLVGQPGDRAGAVAWAGDLDGDGLSDLVVSGWAHDRGGVEHVGVVYVVRGPVQGVVQLANADAVLLGREAHEHADVAAGAGDVNGDGIGDLIVGSDRAAGGVGAAYLWYGPVTGTHALVDADAVLEAEVNGAGASVAGAGDLNGDGCDDLLVGATGTARGVIGAGSAYVVYGPVVGPVQLANADLRLYGEEENDHAGISVSAAGDVDGDGTGDLLVGADQHGVPGRAIAGAAYLVLGGW